MDKITSVPTHTKATNKERGNKQNINKTHNWPQEKLSIVSVICRICYDDNKQEPIITPCRCKGTVAFIHRSCLETWLAESNTTECELCHHVYQTERTPKHTAKQSIWRWLRYQPNNIGFQVRGLRSDLVACALLTPLAIVITYICLFSADYYNQQKFSNTPAARWTSISLLLMISIMLVGYYLWVYMVVRYHGRVWYYYWQRDCTVRYIPENTVNISYNNNNNINTERAVDEGEVSGNEASEGLTGSFHDNFIIVHEYSDMSTSTSESLGNVVANKAVCSSANATESEAANSSDQSPAEVKINCEETEV